MVRLVITAFQLHPLQKPAYTTIICDCTIVFLRIPLLCFRIFFSVPERDSFLFNSHSVDCLVTFQMNSDFHVPMIIKDQADVRQPKCPFLREIQDAPMQD